ncbi:MAG: hypothetical protein HOW97_13885 [Catenulispora sp.]|nr:hypothetical protein [Catenulispora sp.]
MTPDSSSAVTPDAAAVDQADPASPARFLRLLASGRPADIAAVVSRLPEAELAAAVDAAQGRIALPVREYILTEGPSCALIALARHALHDRGEGTANTVDRLLLRRDPDADAFFFEHGSAPGPSQRARIVILRDRKGPDGRVEIPPRVRQSLLDELGEAAPDWRLLAEVAAADDPDLVLALMPHARRLSATGAARVILTLDAHGRRRTARRHRALWSGRGRAFTVLGFRRFAALRRRYPPDTGFSVTPAPGVEALTVAQYRSLVDRCPFADSVGYSRVRTAARAALRTGTLSAADVLEHTRPAALAVTLAAHADTDWHPGDQRAADDVRALIARRAGDRLARDPVRWSRVIAGVNTYPGTLPELLADPDPHPARAPRARVDHSSHIVSDFDAANILLAIAPRDVAAQALATRGMKRAITAAAGNVPLCRALVEHVVSRGTGRQRERLAANEATPDAVLIRLADSEAADRAGIPHAILDREFVGPQALLSVYAVVPRDGRFRDWIVDLAGFEPATALHALRHTADDPDWLLRVLRSAVTEFDAAGRAAAYALLAETAGVEAVWALELDRCGDLEAMDPQVRASMAAGDAEPLVEAARADPVPDRDEVWPDEPPRSEEYLDQPLRRPLVELIRTRLDGRVDRWLALAELVRAEPGGSDEQLIMETVPM